MDLYYKMPPVGITETRGRIGDRVLLNYDVRCGHQECWFVGHATNEDDAQSLLNSHSSDCPTAPHRGQLPTGLSTLEKLWDQLDDVTQAITEGQMYKVGNQTLDGAQLRGYARGICFALSMMTFPHFRTETDIVREAAARYKIRKGTMPYRPTPTYRNNPVARPTSPPPGERSAHHGATRAANSPAPSPRRPRGTLSQASQAAAKLVDLSSIDAKKRLQILNGATLMGFAHEELAIMYDVTPETIKVIVDGRAS